MRTKKNILIVTTTDGKFIRLCSDVTDLTEINEPIEPDFNYRFITKSVLELSKHYSDVADVSESFCNKHVYADKSIIYIAETYDKINIYKKLVKKLVNYLDEYE